MGERKHPRFGDRVRGIYAAESNPIREGYFVEVIRRRGRFNAGTSYRCTDGKGRFWEYPVESVEVIGPPTLYQAGRRSALLDALEALDQGLEGVSEHTYDTARLILARLLEGEGHE